MIDPGCAHYVHAGPGFRRQDPLRSIGIERSCAGNCLNQWTNTNKAALALKTLEFMVVPDMFITPTARYADIVLPVASHLEKTDLNRPWPSGPYYEHTNRAVAPLYECKTDFEIACEHHPDLVGHNPSEAIVKFYLRRSWLRWY